MLKLNVNGRWRRIDVEGEMPLLWVLRDVLGLMGTKFGCGVGVCGSCAVIVDDELVRSCVVPVATVAGKRVVTIEGLARNGSHPVQKAFVKHQVPQCGYCHSGQVMAAAHLLKKKPRPTDKDIDEAVTGICRCGTYQRLRTAIHDAARGKKA
jgi:isoquinoline 1-oxidoreductase subunit alpha